MIGDQDQAARYYLGGAVFLLGALVAMLVFADQAHDRATAQRRADRRRHDEELALLDARVDRHEHDLRSLIDGFLTLGHKTVQVEKRVGDVERLVVDECLPGQQTPPAEETAAEASAP